MTSSTSGLEKPGLPKCAFKESGPGRQRQHGQRFSSVYEKNRNVSVLALKINESQIQLLCDLAAVCGNIKGIKWFKPYKVLRVIFNLYPVFFVEYRYTI